jgi:periplasmic divalent cation tolerance protein
MDRPSTRAGSDVIAFVISTFPDEETAASIVRDLIVKKLAACGTIIPKVRSIYCWKNEICDSQEALVLFKIAHRSIGEFEIALKKAHPYEVPEIVAFEATATSEAYAKWVLQNLDSTQAITAE